MKLIVKGGRVVDPVSATDQKLDILIQRGCISKVAANIKAEANTKVLDATGQVVSPGFIDMHVHLREPGQENKESIESGSRAAVRGGFTTIICMPNTDPVNDNRSVTEYITARASQVGLVDVLPVAAISKNLAGENISEMGDLVEGGAVGFSDDGRCVMSAGLIRKALEYTRMLDVPIIEHPEDHTISGDGQVNEGFISYKFGLRGILNAAEEVIVARDIILQDRIKSSLHLTHISTAGSVELIRNAKDRGIQVSADATPHHLLLNEELITTYNSVYKMNPPLRTENDRLALIEGIKTGVIDCIASDHAPHSRDEKDREYEYTPFGVIGMESSFPVIYDRLVHSGVISLNRFIELYSCNPARIMKLKDRGRLEVGYRADITLFDPEKPFEIREDDFQSRANNCPFLGWKGRGAVTATIVNGKIVYQPGDKKSPVQ